MQRTWATSRTWTLLLGFLLCFFAQRAHAQSAQETALARTLFEEGVTMADHGDWAGAADRFGRAFALKPTSGIAFNYASALVETGKLVEACELFRSVSRDASASPELRAQSEAKLAQVSPRIAYLTVRLDTDPGPDARVEIDGADWPRAAWGITSPLDPGQHVVRLSRSGIEVERQELALAEGQRGEVTMHAAGPSQPALQPVTLDTGSKDADTDQGDAGHAQTGGGSSERRPFFKNWVVWAAVGAVVVGGVVAGVLIASGDKEKKTQAPVMGDANPAVIRW